MLNMEVQDYIIVTQIQANTLLLEPTQKSSCGTYFLLDLKLKLEPRKSFLNKGSNFLGRQVKN
jgi:hypothetical protein